MKIECRLYTFPVYTCIEISPHVVPPYAMSYLQHHICIHIHLYRVWKNKKFLQVQCLVNGITMEKGIAGLYSVHRRPGVGGIPRYLAKRRFFFASVKRTCFDWFAPNQGYIFVEITVLRNRGWLPLGCRHWQDRHLSRPV